MSRTVTERDLSPILAAAKTWIDRCLVEDGSLISADEARWATTNVDSLQFAFVDRPDEGGDDFMTKRVFPK